MGKKKVTAFLADYVGVENLEDILLNSDFYDPIGMTEYKTTELRFVEQEHRTGIITGLFVTTQRKNIPPAHTPGEDNYTAIPLDDGQGLAYPNTILYDPTFHVLFVENNAVGVSEKKICEYFNSHARRLNIQGFKLNLAPILKSEAYERVDNMDIIDLMECQIATPIGLLREQMRTESLSNFAELAVNLNATKTISITVKAEEVSGGISKHEALGFIHLFETIAQAAGFNKRNKLKYKGKMRSPEYDNGMVEEEVNFFLDKINGYFNLDEPNIATNLQFHDRKQGIINVYTEQIEEIRRILRND